MTMKERDKTEKRGRITPSVEDGKRRLALYKSLKSDLHGIDGENRRKVLHELLDYVLRLETDQCMPLVQRLKYYYCAETIFRFLYENKQVQLTKVGVDKTIYQQVKEVLTAIAEEDDEN